MFSVCLFKTLMSLVSLFLWLLVSDIHAMRLQRCNKVHTYVFTVIWWSHSPALRQYRPVHFLWLAQKPGMDFSSRSKAPPKRCLFSIPPPSKDCSFPLGLGRERLWVGILKGRYINFDWLIDWLILIVIPLPLRCSTSHFHHRVLSSNYL